MPTIKDAINYIKKSKSGILNEITWKNFCDYVAT